DRSSNADLVAIRQPTPDPTLDAVVRDLPRALAGVAAPGPTPTPPVAAVVPKPIKAQPAQAPAAKPAPTPARHATPAAARRAAPDPTARRAAWGRGPRTRDPGAPRGQARPAKAHPT